MTRNMKSYRICAFAVGLLAGLNGASAQSLHYTVTDLGIVGPPQTTAAVQPFGGASRGLMAGGAIVGVNEHAVLWYQGQRMDLGTLGLQGSNSIAFGVNDRGQVVGQSETWTSYPVQEDFCGFHAVGLPTNGGACLPFLWQNGVMRPLPTLGGYNGVAIWIDAAGDAAGWAENAVTEPGCSAPQKLQVKPVIWQKGKVQELPTLPGDDFGAAYFITDSGIAGGSSGQCGTFNTISFAPLQPLHAVLWQDGKLTNIGNLGGTGHGIGNTPVSANNQGQVVGVSDLAGDQVSHAFLWTKTKGMQDLGAFPGDLDSFAVNINEAGQIVGLSLDENFDLRAVTWQNGIISDVNDLIPPDSPLYLLCASTIDSQGQLAGLAADEAGNLHGFVATPSGPAGHSQGGHPRWALSDEGRRILKALPYGRFLPERHK